MTSLFPPVDPGRKKGGSRTRRTVPFRAIVPNLVTSLALCAGLTSIRLAMEGRFELAVWAILVAAILDAIDGRVARLLKSTSNFGAQLDSLADFVNFGVAPALLIYIWVLDGIGPIGWTACLVYAICAALRLARFNAALDGEPEPDWQKDYFVGVPSPAGALTVLFPLSLAMSGVTMVPEFAILIAGYTILIGLLMVSRLPTYSGKRAGARIPGESVMPLFVLVVIFAGLLASYTFQVLAIGTALYIVHIPFAWRTWRRHMAEDETNGQPLSGNGQDDAPDADDEIGG
jgi:CDP-diacylglycerol--serine O-phosphatidyltransferase